MVSQKSFGNEIHNCQICFDRYKQGLSKLITKQEFEKKFFEAADALTKEISQFDKIEA